MIDRIYILTKNESANIERCLGAIAGHNVPIVVLDSGSTDTTIRQALAFSGVEVESYSYTNHCDAYNHITSVHGADEIVGILDADIVPEEGWTEELESLFQLKAKVEVLKSPVEMYWCGSPLPFGSLYPPKPVAFRGGRRYFESVGHGERLVSSVRSMTTNTSIRHDDRRDYDEELVKQWRYARTTAERAETGTITRLDGVRVRSPFLLAASPFASYVWRAGFLSGRIGVVYALDRLIAEALTYRAGLLHRMLTDSGKHTVRKRSTG